MGFTALAIADRVWHESIDITYRYAHLFPTRQKEMADKLDMERNDRSSIVGLSIGALMRMPIESTPVKGPRFPPKLIQPVVLG